MDSQLKRRLVKENEIDVAVKSSRLEKIISL